MKLTGVGHTSIVDKNIDSSFSINDRFYHFIHLVLFCNVKYEFMDRRLVKFRHGFETSGSCVDDASMIGVCLASGIVSRYQLLSRKTITTYNAYPIPPSEHPVISTTFGFEVMGPEYLDKGECFIC